ncbi:LAQU0S18e01090g1_1 [Lachancea quebecensis]|uniref:Dynein heavy chain, cytoplasmic n=1 Tax=Lachancea quebecensis TaxID=1654605 RepID=A0A0P1KWX1_9SACH|nr:LAQU0S18e01090g1_1 [Lachancea quebecensis]
MNLSNSNADSSSGQLVKEAIKYCYKVSSALLTGADGTTFDKFVELNSSTVESFVTNKGNTVLYLGVDLNEFIKAKLSYEHGNSEHDPPSKAHNRNVLALIKSQPVLSLKIALESQLLVLSVAQGLELKAFHKVMAAGVRSLFECALGTRQLMDASSDSAHNICLKINDLCSSMRNVENLATVPNLLLSGDWLIKDIVSKGATPENFKEFLPEAQLGDSVFLNSLQKIVNGWVYSAESVANSTRTIEDGGAKDEISFWQKLEQNLLHVQDQLQSDEAKITVEILKSSRRPQTAFSLLIDTTVPTRLKEVKSYNQFLCELPMQKLYTAASLSKVEVLIDAFAIAFKRLRTSLFPIFRAQALTEQICAEVINKIKELVPQLASSQLDEYELTTKALESLLDKWDGLIESVTLIMREVTRRRSEKYVPIRIASKVELLRHRLGGIRKLRTTYQELSLDLDHPDTLKYRTELPHVYEPLSTTDCLSCSKEQWYEIEKTCSQRLGILENKILNALLLKLHLCESTTEMFALLEKFRSLLSRPRLRKGIQQYHNVLLNAVMEELSKLKGKLLDYDGDSKAAALNDLPPVASSLMRIKLLKRRVSIILSKLTLLLGRDWRSSTEGGAHLYSECNVILEGLSEEKIVSEWCSKVCCFEDLLQEPIFKVLKDNNGYTIFVNSNRDFRDLFKEVRNLCWMGYELPSSLFKASTVLRDLYPVAIEIMELLDTFIQITNTANGRPALNALLGSLIKRSWIALKSCINESWKAVSESEKAALSAVTLDLNEQIPAPLPLFRSLVSEVLVGFNRVESLESSLTTFLSSIDFDNFSELSLKNWISHIVSLKKRIVESGNDDYTDFEAYLENQLEKKVYDLTRLALMPENFPGKKHEVTIGQDGLLLEPSLESTKTQWFEYIQKTVKISFTLKAYYEDERNENPVEQKTKSLAAFKSQVQNVALSAVKEVESLLQSARSLIRNWNRYTALWRSKEQIIGHQPEPDIVYYFNLYLDFKKERSEFESMGIRVKLSDSLTISLQEFQSKIKSCYEEWDMILLNELRSQYEKQSSLFHSELSDCRKLLESGSISVESCSLDELYEVCSTIESLKESWFDKERLLNALHSVHILMKENEMPSFSEVIQGDQLDLDMKLLKQISEKRQTWLTDRRSVILSRVEMWNDKLLETANSFREEWQKCKPVSQDLEPEDTLKVLELKEHEVSLERDKLQKVNKISLFISIPVEQEFSLIDVAADIAAYKKAWNAISIKWALLKLCLSKPWVQSELNHVKEELEHLADEHHESEIAFANQTVLKAFSENIQRILNSIKLLKTVKNKCMKPRHWKILFQKASDTLPSGDALDKMSFTLDDVLSLELASNEDLVSEVLRNAKSEEVIEHSLEDIESRWRYNKFLFAKHPGDIIIVKNWNTLLQLITDDSNTLTAMKGSPHYKVFEQRSVSWELKFNELAMILTNWAESQRLWLHLHGALGSSASSSTFLRSESTRFETITFDFNSITSVVLQSDLVLDILHILDFPRSLRNILESLKRIVGALNGYLESQRERYPRLYFLGNEDLLQLMGASQNLYQASHQLGKIYGGLSSLKYEDKEIFGICSPEGETLEFLEPMLITNYPEMQDWVAQIGIQMKSSIISFTEDCLQNLKSQGVEAIPQLFERHVFQVLLLSFQIRWTTLIENAISQNEISLEVNEIQVVFNQLKSLLKGATSFLKKRKIESLIVECIHYISVSEELCAVDVARRNKIWSSIPKYYFNDSEPDMFRKITVTIENNTFYHGLEYIGVPERLIYTPLMKNCFVAMAHALAQNLGGSPFGPAGTGKTETIKALGQNLGRFVLVFNCDESFEFQSLGRLLLGIGQVGAWGCFDEFNRLEESIMSAVSTQIETIQDSLARKQDKFVLLGKSVHLNNSAGIFITMNRGYKGRRELPDNLRKKFRQFSMKSPDFTIIAGVILTTLGFEDARNMARKICDFLTEMERLCSQQRHYDFGLRAMKGILRNCRVLKNKHGGTDQDILLESLNQMLSPRLIKSDENAFYKTISEIFPDVNLSHSDAGFCEGIRKVCQNGNKTSSNLFIKKCDQLFQIQNSQQAIILSGPPGAGKTAIWRSTLDCMESVDGVKNSVFPIDLKVLTKEQLYGSLDPVTFEWTDGVFTSIIRKVTQDQTEKYNKTRVWIIFDGDLDPEYVETINSVLDDNKVLTLPNGERFKIPDNLRLLFEIDDLNVATPATISRCAVIIVDQPTCSPSDILPTLLAKEVHGMQIASKLPKSLIEAFCNIIYSTLRDKIHDLHDVAKNLPNTMNSTLLGSLDTFVSLTCSQLFQKSESVQKLSEPSFSYFVKCILCINLVWAMAGSCNEGDRSTFEKRLKTALGIEDLVSDDTVSLTDYEVIAGELKLRPLSAAMPRITLEPHEVVLPDLMIPTIDTIKHERLIIDLLCSGRSPILCGPPGSGKTMTIFNALKNSKKFDLIGLTFSKETTVASFLDTLKHHTTKTETAKGISLKPKSLSKDLVVFCDEINLPETDEYGAQPVILLLRQLLEKKGYWDVSSHKWVSLERIYIAGACNPPDNSSRKAMSERFTRHTSVISIDYPGRNSLLHIYEVFFKAVLKLVPELRGYYKEFAHASVELYYSCKDRFLSTDYSHYIYSPRELTRLIKGLYFILTNSSVRGLSQLVECWVYECLRLFSDRLVCNEDKNVFDKIIIEITVKYFPNQIEDYFDIRNNLLCSWISLEYEKTDRRELSFFVKERLKTFNEEELESTLIVHDSMLDHMIRIDRALKQDQGHCILVGPSRSGKRSLTRFVCWMNGIEVIPLTLHRNFHISDFDKFLRNILSRCTSGGQRILLLIDDSSILESSFIERINTLLANSDVPGLFEAEERTKLIADLSQKAEELGLLLDGDEELYSWFTQLISRNLHVVFSINDPNSESATNVINSPALFNRCVLNWMGEWSDQTLAQVGAQIVEWMPLSHSLTDITDHDKLDKPMPVSPLSKKIVDIAILFFKEFQVLNLGRPAMPGQFLDQLKIFQDIYYKKISELEKSQRFIATGLDTMKETVLKIRELNELFSKKEKELRCKEQQGQKTLDNMLSTQNEAERRHEATVEIRKILSVQEKELSSQRARIMSDLASVEPQVLEAQRGVNNIKKQHMTEIRSMFNPPHNVKLTLEAVCLVLGYHSKEWRDIQHFVRKDEFISSIVQYDTEAMMNATIRDFIKKEYLMKSGFNYEAVNHASKACGPLFQWVVAQVEYSTILNTISPLKSDVANIEKEMLQTKARLLASEDMISDYRDLVESSKREYSNIIRETEAIKAELSAVEQKVSRSRKLLESLASENARWSSSTSTFEELKQNIVGDCLLSSLFINYCGARDRKTRLELIRSWKKHLCELDVFYDQNYTFCNHLVDFQERSRWISSGLPDDDTCIENFFILLNSLHYPFVIDPEFKILCALRNHFENTIAITSFLDSGFVKKLENTLRFGGCILIQDGEFYDPIISKLIAKEFRKTGGKETVQIGDRDVDIAPNFFMIILTRDASWNIPLFLRARMSIVNFTVDKNSIEPQALEIALECQKPELYEQRRALAQLNGEYKLHLSCLEKELLEALNSSPSSILENDTLITTLELLKTQSNEIQGKILETKGVIEKVEQTVNEFRALSQHAFRIYSIIEQLPSLHWAYQVTVNFFLKSFRSIFNRDKNHERKDTNQLLRSLYQRIFEILSPGLLEDDKIALGVMLLVSFFESAEPSTFHEVLVQLMSSIRSTPKSPMLNMPLAFESVEVTAYTQNLIENTHEFDIYHRLQTAMDFLPLVTSYQLKDYIKEWDCGPVVIVCERGTDSTYRVSQLALELSQELSIVSLGSSESTSMAENALSHCAKEGGWLLIQNLQMSPDWVKSVLTKRLELLTNDASKSPSFRIFMTCELEGRAPPPPLIQASWKVVHEMERGLLESAKDVWGTVSRPNSICSPEKLFCRFLLAWFHALLVENSRLHPLGFTKKYDFNDSDFAAGVAYLDVYFNCLSSSHDSIKSVDISWIDLQFNIATIIYGGKIDDEKDLLRCIELARGLFNENAFAPNFEIAPGLLAPQNRREWISIQEWLMQCRAPENWSQWLKLAKNVEIERRELHAVNVASSVTRILEGL